MSHWKPKIGIFIESEIWPNLILESQKKEITLLLLNARFSPNSLKKNGLIKSTFLLIMKNFKIITTMSQSIKESLVIMGLKNSEFIGNLNFMIQTMNLIVKKTKIILLQCLSIR